MTSAPTLATSAMPNSQWRAGWGGSAPPGDEHDRAAGVLREVAVVDLGPVPDLARHRDALRADAGDEREHGRSEEACQARTPAASAFKAFGKRTWFSRWTCRCRSSSNASSPENAAA